MTSELARFKQHAGRYMLFGQIGAGGMGVVHLARRTGPAGFSRLVAVKRMHTTLASDREFVNAFLDEARIAARVHHPNVVSIHDVVIANDDVMLVMEYVHGCSLSSLLRAQDGAIPPTIAAAIALDILHGLQAAHDAKDERGNPLELVHRDVSPQNVIVGADGVARVLDFGIAKALGRLHTTTNGVLKGKLGYMAPERLADVADTPRIDVFGAAVVVWEMLMGQRFIDATSEEALLAKVSACVYRPVEDPSLAKYNAILERALQRDPEKRYATPHDLAIALEGVAGTASRVDVIAWVKKLGQKALENRTLAIEEIEQCSVPPSDAPATASVHEVRRELEETKQVVERPSTRPPPEEVSEERRGATDVGVTRTLVSRVSGRRSRGQKITLGVLGIILALGVVTLVRVKLPSRTGDVDAPRVAATTSEAPPPAISISSPTPSPPPSMSAAPVVASAAPTIMAPRPKQPPTSPRHSPPTTTTTPMSPPEAPTERK